MDKIGSKNKVVSRVACFTVKQLSELFGKSEDTIRRWKNEGIGRGEDSIRLNAIENGDATGRRTGRHLVFTGNAVRDFVRANPFLMDDAPQLRAFMDSFAARPSVIALPNSLEDYCKSTFRNKPAEEHEAVDDAKLNYGSLFRGLMESIDKEDEQWVSEANEPVEDEDPVERFRRELREEAFGTQDAYEDACDEEEQYSAFGNGREIYGEESLHYMLRLLREQEHRCMTEANSARQASTLFYRRSEYADKLSDGGRYVTELVRRREQELEDELEQIRQASRALEKILYRR